MARRATKTDCVNRPRSAQDILDESVTPRQLTRVCESERERHVVEVLGLVEIAAKLSNLNVRIIERYALLVGKSIALTLAEKRSFMLFIDLFSVEKIFALMRDFEEEQRRLAEHKRRIRANKPIA